MSREDAERLLGGYAAGTLTPEEREALFAAALDDQELFNALAQEEPLRELLEEPAARAQLLRALDDAPVSWWRRAWRPALPLVAMAAITILMVITVQRDERRNEVEEAKVRIPAAATQPNALPRMFKLPPEKLRPVVALPQAPKLVTTPAAPLVAGKILSMPAPPPPPPPVRAEAPPPVQSQFGLQAGTGAVQQAGDAEGRGGGGGGTRPADAASESVRLVAPSFRAAQQVIAVADVLPASVRYSIVKRQDSGETAEVDPEQPVERTDTISLRLEPSQRGYLYVLHHDPAGDWHLIAGPSVQPGAPVLVPPTGSLPAGTGDRSEFLVVFSQVPQVIDLQALPEQARVPTTRVPNSSTRWMATGILRVATSFQPQQEFVFPVTLRYK